MGNILIDNNGNALLSNNKALEVTSTIDSNIQAGNIKKDVTILGVTGTYEGSGGGGSFRCTNKIAAKNTETSYNHQYTFEGTLANCAIGILKTPDGDMGCGFVQISENASSTTYDLKTFTPGTLVTDILTEQDGYWPQYGKCLLLSKDIYITGSYSLNSEVHITNGGLFTFVNNVAVSQDSQLTLFIVFKGTDGIIDFDVVNLMLESD